MNLTFENVDQFCRQVDLSGELARIDLGAIRFIRPFALIYIGMYIRHHRLRGHRFQLSPPKSPVVYSYLTSQKFWDRFNFVGPTRELLYAGGTGHLTSFNDIIDIENGPYVAEDTGRLVRKILTGESIHVDVYLVEELVSELVDNFSQHSETKLAACALQWYPRKKRLDFAIGDCGIGIRRSLAQNPSLRHIQYVSHSEAAERAFQEGVGRRPQGGMGLADVRANVDELNGRLLLSTGDGWLLVDSSGGRIGKQACDLPGVQIEVSVPAES